MREYEPKAFDVAGQDVGGAWLIVGMVLSVMLFLPLAFELGASLHLSF